MTEEFSPIKLLDEKKYRILDENNNLIPATMMEWGLSLEKKTNRVRLTLLNKRKNIYVSTVCLGLDHGYGSTPLWFETMVFGTSIDQSQDRYETFRQAELGHERMVFRARQVRQIRNRHNRGAFLKAIKGLRKDGLFPKETESAVMYLPGEDK